MSLFKIKKKDRYDQPAHFVVAFLTVFIAAKLGGPAGAWSGAFMGFMLGMVREITEEGTISLPAVLAVLKSPGSRFDLLFWTMGGTAGGLAA